MMESNNEDRVIYQPKKYFSNGRTFEWGKDLTSEQDFLVRSETLWFFLQMMEQWTVMLPPYQLQ